MVLFFGTLFVILVAVFGMFLTFARPENMERPFLVGALTTLTSLLAGWPLWLQWHRFDHGGAGFTVLCCLLAASGFGFGRAIDFAMGARRETADELQATLGADLSD